MDSLLATAWCAAEPAKQACTSCTLSAPPWQGKAGCAPTAAELAEALTSRQLFLYCGHGGGEQYISGGQRWHAERARAHYAGGCSPVVMALHCWSTA